MKRFLVVLFILSAVVGCSKNVETGVATSGQSMANSANNAARYLAYQHHIQLDTDEHKIREIFEAAQAVCREASGDFCTVLESRIETGRSSSASLKFRAKPTGIHKLIGSLSKQAKITNQSTTAEDLAAPIEDTAKKLTMLNDYRSKLEALRNRANNDVDALIKINRELSQVQTELEAATGKNAQLMQRVETQILTVSIGSVQNQGFWHPISISMSDFGNNLSQGVSIAITGIAYLLPWIFFILMFIWVSRIVWRRLKGPKNKA
ncbi:DUF4349 domain-containing protein [Undibacterium sp. LX40W]|uniref:DUF4349 domain-containing protein n=1 Tax=Undibacterium nitidum TaxID=2762298 RepID=A0A923KTS5_9BURK|nr:MULTISPECIES: DUF4349 domain-containing protein [Undibacterium]MBC3881924.1 DUF4349 domain-containing protein [Undibacterium nitidum]MBC3892079.1 DUF4349 domain-containing protein [Undibacterium sp. LX40W]